MKIKLIKFKRVKSTNDIALKLIKKKKSTTNISLFWNSEERKRYNGQEMGISKRKSIYINFF